jgi:hypothetical protein
MTTDRLNYTTPEWNTLQTAVVGAGFYVRKLTPGFFDSWRAKHEAEETIEEGKELDSLFFRQLCDVDDFKSYLPKNVSRTPAAIEAVVLQAIDESINILAEKDPKIIPAFKSLLLDIAHETAEEVDGISAEEKSAISKIEKVINGDLDFLESWRVSEPFND